ncbi:GNAT family N-acetyltransferase [Pedobacter sp. AW1-32]|uniref:GNAT family N-acetyltransferase n=1 Tax=Pedobacter sp. AW1-32 TaxID=3383026 RepID=UPI003FED9F73
MIQIRLSATNRDLDGIIDLQQKNLKHVLSADDIQQQGFVTVSHTLDDLQKMHKHEKNVIATNGQHVIGYVLGMTEKSKNDIPRLIEMYDSFDEVFYGDKPVSDYNYVVVGQVCIDKDFRAKGLFRSCYDAYKDHFSARYDFAITEIASNNLRSMTAHAHVGFKSIHDYTDQSGDQWNIVLWDWK